MSRKLKYAVRSRGDRANWANWVYLLPTIPEFPRCEVCKGVGGECPQCFDRYESYPIIRDNFPSLNYRAFAVLRETLEPGDYIEL